MSGRFGERVAAWLNENPRWRGLIVIVVLLAGLVRVWTAKPDGISVLPVVTAVAAAHAAGYALDRWVGLVVRLALGLVVFGIGWVRVHDMYPVLAAGFILLSPSPYVRSESASAGTRDGQDRPEAGES